MLSKDAATRLSWSAILAHPWWKTQSWSNAPKLPPEPHFLKYLRRFNVSTEEYNKIQTALTETYKISDRTFEEKGLKKAGSSQLAIVPSSGGTCRGGSVNITRLSRNIKSNKGGEESNQNNYAEKGKEDNGDVALKNMNEEVDMRDHANEEDEENEGVSNMQSSVSGTESITDENNTMDEGKNNQVKLNTEKHGNGELSRNTRSNARIKQGPSEDEMAKTNEIVSMVSPKNPGGDSSGFQSSKSAISIG